jgi:hypothetical protein
MYTSARIHKVSINLPDYISSFLSICLFTDLAEGINKSLDDITERWKHLKVEITSVQTMLEEVIEYWKRFNACVDLFHVWLGDTEQMLKKPPEERGVSFSSLLCI